ncbi:hypothetical protein BD413DRAFT_208699 [Trametes elegans]|nr:hypothetical protein BD413DRAFT_208699 [Trametes elegans]
MNQPEAPNPGHIGSRTLLVKEVALQATAGIYRGPDLSEQITFRCCDEQAAVLILKSGGQREALLPFRSLADKLRSISAGTISLTTSATSTSRRRPSSSCAAGSKRLGGPSPRRHTTPEMAD